MKISNTKIKVEAIDFGGLKLSDANKIKSIRVKVEASHSGMINKNNFLYIPSAMRDGVDSWIDNPVIYGHNSDNLKDVNKHLGYIDDAKYVHYEEFGQDVLDFDSIDDIISVLEEADARKLYDSESEYKGLGHIELIATIDKPDAIKKILDGTYSDVQIGGDAKDVYCSICSQNIAKTKEICHSRGKVYDGVQAYWIGDQISYEELSFVETPADPHVKTVVLKDSESGYDNGKIKILDFVLYDTEEDIVKKIKPTEFMETANKLLAVRLHELGLQDSAEFNADQYAKLKDSDYLFAGDKVLPIHDQAHLLIAQEILESIDNEGVAVEDQLDLAPMKIVISKRNKRLFKSEQVVIADEIQKIADSVKTAKVEVSADPVVVEDNAGSKEYDLSKLNLKDDTYDGHKILDMDEDELLELRKHLPCDEWGVWDLRHALSGMISATMSVDKMAEVVKGALNELFPGGMKTQDSYASKRLVALEDEVEAYAAESDSLKTKLKTSLVHNILVAEGKLEDEVYKSKLMSREIVSLEDKLEDLFPGQVADKVTVEDAETEVEGGDVDNKNVDIQDAAVDNTDPVKDETVKVEDGTEEEKEEVLTVVQIRDTYKKTMREKGLVAASIYIKDLSQKGKLPKHFKV